MALNFDDRVLGGKVDNYVSSSEDSGDEGAPGGMPPIVADIAAAGARSNRTGPKGVLEDYHEFRRQEKEQRVEERASFYAKLKATAPTVKTDREEAEEKRLAEDEDQDDEFMKEYRIRRMREIYNTQQALMPRFGTLISLDAENFLTEVDNEPAKTLVVVHVYEPSIPACDAMNGCLIVLASEHPTVKFCRVRASDVKMSQNFVSRGLPTILVYQDKHVIANFVSMSRLLGTDFFANDVEKFLQEHGLLCEKEPSKFLGSPALPDMKKRSQSERKASSSDDD